MYFIISAVAPPVVTRISTTSTTIQLSWSSSGLLITGYEVSWQKDTSEKCPVKDTYNGSATVPSTSYRIIGVDEDSRYTIIVKATDSTGSNAVSVPITALTKKAGKAINSVKLQMIIKYHVFFQFHLLLPLWSIYLMCPHPTSQSSGGQWIVYIKMET